MALRDWLLYLTISVTFCTVLNSNIQVFVSTGCNLYAETIPQFECSCIMGAAFNNTMSAHRYFIYSCNHTRIPSVLRTTSHYFSFTSQPVQYDHNPTLCMVFTVYLFLSFRKQMCVYALIVSLNEFLFSGQKLKFKFYEKYKIPYCGLSGGLDGYK